MASLRGAGQGHGVTTAQLTSWMPGASWARNAGIHLKWMMRQVRADAADRSGRHFRYVHPLVGPFVYHPSDYLSRRLFLHNDFEQAELQYAIDRARAGGTILDVGANVGLYTAACARAVGDRGRVIALEPSPVTFQRLTATCSALGLSNVTLVEAAAGQISGTADLVSGRGSREVHQHLADVREYAAADRFPIQVRRIDDLCGAEVDRVTLLKIDVEGHEVSALAGAEQILSCRRASLIVEFYAAGLAAAGESPAALWSLLSRTHACVGIVAPDGSRRPPTQSGVTDDLLNTLWEPR